MDFTIYVREMKSVFMDIFRHKRNFLALMEEIGGEKGKIDGGNVHLFLHSCLAKKYEDYIYEIGDERLVVLLKCSRTVPSGIAERIHAYWNEYTARTGLYPSLEVYAICDNAPPALPDTLTLGKSDAYDGPECLVRIVKTGVKDGILGDYLRVMEIFREEQCKGRERSGEASACAVSRVEAECLLPSVYPAGALNRLMNLLWNEEAREKDGVDTLPETTSMEVSVEGMP